MLTVGSLFSGIGGIDLAFETVGFEIVYQVEIDDYCQQVLSNHWPEVQGYRDIFTVNANALPAAAVITAGFPCQPFSVAGNRRGEADERFLWPEILRIISAKRPHVVFLENVPGLRTIDSGNTFKRILRELAEIGYDAQWHHLRASDVGAPHRRERLFIVAYLNHNGYNASTNSSGTQNQKQYIQTYQQSGKPKCIPFNCNNNGFRKYRYVKPSNPESRMGRIVYGLSDRLDRHQFPAPPGPQYAWEPARTTTQTENRTARIKALGNSVVPQVIYPIALAIREYLEANHV